MPFTNKTNKKPLWQHTVREIYISKTIQITANVNVINTETIAYLFHEKQKLLCELEWKRSY